jgi:hypothetical protein
MGKFEKEFQMGERANWNLHKQREIWGSGFGHRGSGGFGANWGCKWGEWNGMGLMGWRRGEGDYVYPQIGGRRRQWGEITEGLRRKEGGGRDLGISINPRTIIILIGKNNFLLNKQI